jgi:hypothetical protein
MIACKLCGKEIEQPRQAWREAVGWVSPIGAKGMTAERKTGELAHAECISLLRAGVDVRQETLV